MATAVQAERAVFAMAKCRKCGAVKRVEGAATKRFRGFDSFRQERYEWVSRFAPMQCWNGCVSRVIGDTTVEINEIRGRKTDTLCDARCTDAKGHKCECSCGGKNHGNSWS